MRTITKAETLSILRKVVLAYPLGISPPVREGDDLYAVYTHPEVTSQNCLVGAVLRFLRIPLPSLDSSLNMQPINSPDLLLFFTQQGVQFDSETLELLIRLQAQSDKQVPWGQVQYAH